MKIRDKIVLCSTLELRAFSYMLRLKIMLYNSLNSEERYSLIINSIIQPNQHAITNYIQYHGMKSKDLEELIPSPRFIKEI